MRNTLLTLGFLFLLPLSVHAQENAQFVNPSTSATGRNQVIIQNQGLGGSVIETIFGNYLNQVSIILKREENIAARIQTRSRKIEKSGGVLGDFADKELQLNDDIAKAGVRLSQLSDLPFPASSSDQDYSSYRNRLESLRDEIQNILTKEKQLVSTLKDISQ